MDKHFYLGTSMPCGSTASSRGSPFYSDIVCEVESSLLQLSSSMRCASWPSWAICRASVIRASSWAINGLIPSEDSSGEQRRQDAITKAGNRSARRALMEAAWAYQYPAKVSALIARRQAELPKVALDIGPSRRCDNGSHISPPTRSGPPRRRRRTLADPGKADTSLGNKATGLLRPLTKLAPRRLLNAWHVLRCASVECLSRPLACGAFSAAS